MIDVAYVIGTVVFFGLMLLYTAGCERLGRLGASQRADEESR